MEENKGLIVVKQLPIIEEQLQALSKEIDEKVNKALSLVCNEETRKDVKEVRADLNKQFAELEEQRKAVKKAVLDPYNQFEDIYKKCVTEKFKLADSELKNKVEAVENGLKEEKRQEAINYFNEYAKSLVIDFVTFDDMNLNITLNASKKSIQKAIEDFLNKIDSDLNTLEMQENRNEMLVEYKKNGYNLNNAITTVLERIERIKQEEARKEELAKQKEVEAQTVAKVEEVATVEEPLQAPVAETTDKTKLYTMKFTVQGTIEQLKAVKEFLEREGIKYE